MASPTFLGRLIPNNEANAVTKVVARAVSYQIWLPSNALQPNVFFLLKNADNFSLIIFLSVRLPQMNLNNIILVLYCITFVYCVSDPINWAIVSVEASSSFCCNTYTPTQQAFFCQPYAAANNQSNFYTVTTDQL